MRSKKAVMSLVDSEIFDVRLEKRSANDAYGMKVGCAGDGNEAGATKVVAECGLGGIAAACGLKVGDVLLRINGVHALDLTNAQMVDLICSADYIDLVIARPLNNNITYVANKAKVVTLVKGSVAESFGFELTSDINADGATHEVVRITEGGYADGKLEMGDVVVGVNGSDAHHQGHEEVLDQMTGFSTLISLTIERESAAGLRPPAPECERIEFKLKRAIPGEGLGFALCTLPDGANRVGVVAPGGLACSAGLLLGDNVIRVNGTMMAGLDDVQAYGAIAGSGCMVKIIVDRHPQGSWLIPREHHRPETAIHLFHTNEEKMITLKVERHQYSETLGFALNTDEDDERAKDSLNGVAATHSVGPVSFGSAGARSGLCEGDVIHAINNKVVDGMSHDDVASLLSSALFEVLTVGRHTSQVGGARNERLTYLTLELDREQPTDPLGMSIVSENGVHEVEEIFENQTASHSGVAFGDRIVSIDGCSVLGMSHDDVLGLMADKMSIRLSITRAALRDLSHGSVVKLVRNGGGLGMVFATDMHGQGANRQYVHTVEGVIPGGIAEEAGIQTWDHLVTLNGIGLAGSPHDSVLDAMAALDVVSLNIERPVDAHHLPTIETLHIIAERPNQDTPYGVHFATTETEALRSGPTVVQQVGHGSICELAGLRKGDQLVELNGVSVSTLQHNEVEQMFSASSRIEVTVSRSGKSKMDMHYENLHIMVTNAPGEPLGFVFESLHHNGATVVELVRENTAAYAAGLMEGDEIFEINKHRITDELSHHNLVLMLTEPRPPGVPLILGVRRPMDGVEFTEKDLYFKESNSADKLGMHITSEDIGMSEGYVVRTHYVEHTDQDSRAANTGVLPGDEILSINTNPVASMSHAQICANMRGVQVLHIKRRVHSDQSGVTLHNCIIERKQGQPLGVGFETTNPGMQRYRNWISSVVAGSLGDQAGLQPDDVLLSINGTSVTSDNGNGMVHEDVVRLFSSSEVIQITYERPCHTAFHHQGEIGHKFEAVIDRMEVTDAVGITIAALDSGDTALSQVNPDGLGAAAGLHVGDEILKVNGFAINGLPHAQILNMIRKNKTTYIEAVRFGEGQDRVDSWLQNKGEDHIDVLNFTLVRATEHDSFGFAISQDHSMANPPHVVELVNRKTVSEGKLMVGDEVSKVNGLSVTGMGHDEVVKRMRFNTHKLDVEVKRHKDRKFMHIAHNHQTVTLKRERLENCSFGFSLALYEDEGDGADVDREQHKIEIVKEGGLADGLLEVGDELLEINGLIVQQMNHDDVIEQVVSSLELTLVVERSEGMHVLSRPNTSTQWGVSFETGENPDGTTIGHFVKKLEHGGIADKAGVFIDAEVVVVNGKNVRRLNHMQFVQYFRSSLEVAMQLAHNKHGTFQQETMDIMIEKNVDDPFGFMLNELQDGTHHVHEVVGGSVAHNKLVMNDELYAINGTPTKGLKHEAVVGLLQDAAFGADGSYVVELQVGRHVGATPPAFGELVDDEFDATAAKVVEVAKSSAGPVADEDAEEYGEVDTEVDAAMARSLARAKAAAPAPAPAAPVEEGDDEDLPPPPTSPISNFVEPPAKVQSAFKEKLTARRLASGASVNTETLASTPLKERIQQRQQDAAAKTVAANGGTAVELGAVESVEAVSPERKATADAAFQQTFGHLDTPPTTVL